MPVELVAVIVAGLLGSTLGVISVLLVSVDRIAVIKSRQRLAPIVTFGILIGAFWALLVDTAIQVFVHAK